jgi:hypothetical protein
MTTTKPRQSKSAADKATEALAVADRKVASLEARLVKNRLMTTALLEDLRKAQAEQDYLAKNPALPGPKTDPVAHIEGGTSEEPTGNAGGGITSRGTYEVAEPTHPGGEGDHVPAGVGG